MVEKPGNKWQKLPAVAEALSKLLLPLVIAGVGVVFSYVQHRSDVEQRKADRVTSFYKTFGKRQYRGKRACPSGYERPN